MAFEIKETCAEHPQSPKETKMDPIEAAMETLARKTQQKGLETERVAGRITTAAATYREERKKQLANELLQTHGLEPAYAHDVDGAALELLEAIQAVPEVGTILGGSQPKECHAEALEPDSVEASVSSSPELSRHLALAHPKLYAAPRRHGGQKLLVILASVPHSLLDWPSSVAGLPVVYVPMLREASRWTEAVQRWVRDGLVRGAVVCTAGVRGDIVKPILEPLKVASIPLKHIGNAGLDAVTGGIRELEKEAA